MREEQWLFDHHVESTGTYVVILYYYYKRVRIGINIHLK